MKLDAFPKNVEHLQEYVIAEANKRGMQHQLEPRLRLVLEELLINICSYAYPPTGAGAIEIILIDDTQTEHELKLTIRDWGMAFDPLYEVHSPDLTLGIDEREVGGLGVFFAKQFTSALEYRRVNDCNELDMAFSLIN